MMLIPRKNNFDLWEDLFDEPFFGRVENHIMKTDIKETKDKYQVDVDLPGFDKENIKIDLQDGYLTVSAKQSSKVDEGEKGKFLRKERYYGECSRSFYVGDELTEEDIKASFKNGTLSLSIPKKEEVKKIPEKKYINID